MNYLILFVAINVLMSVYPVCVCCAFSPYLLTENSLGISHQLRFLGFV